MIHKKILLLLIVVSLNIFTVQKINAEDRFFKVSHLTVTGKHINYLVRDMNEDGLNDFLFFYFVNDDDESPRYFSIFYQTKDGFRKSADQIFEMEPSAIIFDMADIGPADGQEIIFINKEGLYSYEQKSKGYNTTPKKMMEIDSIFRLSDNSFFKTLNLALDLNDDRIDEIFIPQFDGYSVLNKDENGSYSLTAKLDVSLKNLIASKTSIVTQKEIEKNLFVAAYGTPNIIFADYNKDTRTDIIIVEKKNLKVFFQDRSGNFSNRFSAIVPFAFEITRDYSILMESIISAYGRQEREDQLRIQYIKDINNDGLLDLIVEKVSLKSGFLSPRQHFMFYLGKPNTEDPSKGGVFNDVPDQIIFNPGIVGDHFLKDVDNDGKQDIMIPVMEFGLWKIVTMLVTGKVTVKNNLYILNENDRYPEKANYVQKLRIGFDINDLNVLPVGDFDGDFNADGLRDYLFSFDNEKLLIIFSEELLIKNIQTISDIENNAVKFNIAIPKYGAMVKTHYVNNDEKSDIVIIYPDKNKENIAILIAN